MVVLRTKQGFPVRSIKILGENPDYLHIPRHPNERASRREVAGT